MFARIFEFFFHGWGKNERGKNTVLAPWASSYLSFPDHEHPSTLPPCTSALVPHPLSQLFLVSGFKFLLVLVETGLAVRGYEESLESS